jgi:eukaryotic-like serine/threonine-protein kinase
MSTDLTLSGELCAADLQAIDALCDQFEAAGRSRERPDLAHYLAQAPPGVRRTLFRELLQLDLEIRHARCEQPNPHDYDEQFPDLRKVVATGFRSYLRTRKVHKLFSAAVWPGDGIELGPEDSDVVPGSTVASPASPDDATAVSPWQEFTAHETEAMAVAGYEIQNELGRGGMGVVFKARQIALQRDVALKMIRLGGFASESERVRFQNEAEAVAQLDHPNIVPIYEVGVYRGRPFFSMKLISGSSLDKRLAAFATDPNAAARVVAITALAVHHAHQRGVLHRDLKPGNILLDDNGDPHVTDFGLAKRIDSGGDLTQSGTPVGTPSYMAPEQAEGSKAPLSTTTDVYGLGTILYALLAGRAPFSGTTLIETLDRVRTTAPERPRALNPRVPRDLEVICLKCLEKEPVRRYPSALALAEDLERWMDGVPIQARPVGPCAWGVMWCRRNKALASFAGLFIVAFLGGFAGVALKWREADRERRKSDAVNELLTQQLLARASAELDPLARNPTVRELLDRAGAQLGGWLEGQPEVEAKVRATIGGAYLSLGEHEKAEPHLLKAIRLDTELYGPTHRDTLSATNLLGALLDQMGRRGEAERLLAQNLAECRRLLPRDDRVTLDAALRYGTLLWHIGKVADAETLLRQNVADRARVFKPEHPDTLKAVYLLSRLLTERAQFADAERFAYQYAHDIKCAAGSNHPDNILAFTNQGDVYHAQGKHAQAEQLYRQAAEEAERIFGRDDSRAVAIATKHERLYGNTVGRPAVP